VGGWHTAIIEIQILAVLKELKDVHFSELTRRLGKADKVVWEALNRLTAKKLVERLGEGVYRATSTGIAAFERAFPGDRVRVKVRGEEVILSLQLALDLFYSLQRELRGAKLSEQT